VHCDKSANKDRKSTYINTALGHESCIDYIFTTNIDNIVKFAVLDPDINFSDHVPIMAMCSYSNDFNVDNKSTRSPNDDDNASVTQLRWDRADVLSYYCDTELYLQSIMSELDALNNELLVNTESVDIQLSVDLLYSKIVNALRNTASMHVPAMKKSFLKFWWDEELNLLKQESIKSAQLWKSAGKPRSGKIYQKYQSDRNAYRKSIREHQQLEDSSYTNNLHEALANKNGKEFWKCWRSKFEHHAKYEQIDGCVDKQEIAEKFARHFSNACSSASADRAAELKLEYAAKRASYCGSPLTKENKIDVELVENVITELERGKAAGLDSLTAEHLQHSHPILLIILAKLFDLMLTAGCIPIGFGCSYTVPLIKVDSHTKALTANDFRGISISPVISKVFEHCVLHRF